MTKRMKRPYPNQSPGTILAFIHASMSVETDDCLVPPGSHGRYAKIYVNGRQGVAHRYACQLKHGAPAEGMEARHSCHNTQCVNWKHLSWGTRLENEQDKNASGRRPIGEQSPNAKITAEMARKMKYTPTDSILALSKELGIPRNTAYAIRSGRMWKHV